MFFAPAFSASQPRAFSAFQTRARAIRRIAAIAGLGVLAACGTPQERCIREVTRDMAVVDTLIVEVQGNLQRGFALQDETVYRTQFADCTPAPTEANPNPRARRCPVQVPETVTRAVAIDLTAESAKLASLQAKRAQQASVANTAIAQCRALYPE
jgi:hypothetical protein